MAATVIDVSISSALNRGKSLPENQLGIPGTVVESIAGLVMG